MQRNNKKRESGLAFSWKNFIFPASLLLLLALSICYVLFLKTKGIGPSGNDIWGHLFKSEIMYENIKKGNLYPLYESSWYNGIQLYRYWAPLPYYLMALLIFISGGSLIMAYYLFAGISLFFGGVPFILMGRRGGKPYMGISFALLWFFMPENFRVFFCEGNLPRMLTGVIIPYLIYFLWRYLREGKKAALPGIVLTTAMITLSHVMIAAMAGVGAFLFLLFDYFKNKKLGRSVRILWSMVCGIMITGIWLLPALSGGMVSMNPEAGSKVMESLMYNLSVSLNPMNRISGITDTFYYGIAVTFLSVAGILLAQNKKKAGFILSLVILLLTTPALLPILRKMPMNQLFWMMRFATIVYGFFFLSMLEWKSLKVRYGALAVILLIADCVPSFLFDRYLTEASENAVVNTKEVKEMTVQRAALMDLSSLGSYPSYELCRGEGAVDYTYGWAWQGAATSENIVMLNTALENEAYVYLFDRCLELGNDTVLVFKQYIGKKGKTCEDLMAGAEASGYFKAAETEVAYIFKKDTPKSFGTVTEYHGLAVGSYANIMTLYYPGFTEGNSDYVDDYTLEELCSYKTLFLSGFSYRDREKAEKLLRDASDKGVKVVLDMTHVPADDKTKQQTFLGITTMPVTFHKRFPMLYYNDREILLREFSEDNALWNTGYLTGNMDITGRFSYEGEELVFSGVDSTHNNICYLGLNLMYHATETGDEEALSVMTELFGIPVEQLPLRKLVALEYEADAEGLTIKAEGGYEKAVINTTLAYQDIFDSDRPIERQNNLLKTASGETRITFHYPLLKPGIAVSLLGLLMVVIPGAWSIFYGKKKKQPCAEENAG